MGIKLETKVVGDGLNYPARGHTIICHFTANKPLFLLQCLASCNEYRDILIVSTTYLW